tara:strand:+ start:185 stop:643 length:459 start_codon:yes stop_codon:yes gene_type:complete
MRILIIILLLLTASCSNNKVVKNHGLRALDIKSERIIISKTNKNDVIDLLGKPSSISLFDENLWLFIQSEKINQSIIKLGKTKIIANNVLEVKFNLRGIVEEKKLYQIKDMNDLQVVKDRTTSEYDNTSSLGKLFKSIEQKISSPSKNRKRD